MATDQALVLAAHGSHHDARSAGPIHALADRLRGHASFRAVRVACWKEQPSLAEVLDTVEAATVYVVPVTTAEGYFTDRVFPRELGLDGSRVDVDVRYTAPAVTHERVVDVVLDRVRSVLDAASLDASTVGVALVGHGTPRHPESPTATTDLADRLRASERFAAVEPLFLDQAPSVADLETHLDVETVVVVPHFVADGRHVRRDVPAAMGIEPDGEPFGGPHRLGEVRVWYTRPVGTAPGLVDAVLDRAAEAGATVGLASTGESPQEPPPGDAAARAFLRWIDEGGPTGVERSGHRHERAWGELTVAVSRAADGRRYELRHRDDRGVPTADLDGLQTPAAVRGRTRRDDEDRFRPLGTARTLPRGWHFETADPTLLVRCVRTIYPASVAQWYRERTGRLEPTPFEAVVARQVGRYRDLDEVDDATLSATVDACCGDCVRRRSWTAPALDSPPTDGTFPCPEPCSFLFEAARTFVEADVDDAGVCSDARGDRSVPAAAFGHPENRTRARFRRARRSTMTTTTTPDP